MIEKRTAPVGTKGYPFPEPELRAVCIEVVDGDTVGLLVDRGFHDYSYDRFRLLGVDTAELRDPDPAKRALAVQAAERVKEWLTPGPVEFPVAFWDTIIRPRKDPDSFGRWLADLWALQLDGTEVYVCQVLIDEGLAVPYRR